MQVLVTGGTGLLGQALLSATPDSYAVLATYCTSTPPVEWRSRFRRLDMRDDAEVLALLTESRPDVVVHVASVGSVDQAERDPEGVRRINVGGLQAVVRACERVNARLVFVRQ